MSETITIRTSSERDIIKIVERGPQGASSGGGSGSVTSVALASSDLTITGSPITSSGTITANLANSGATAGTYTKVTVDAKGRVTSGATATAADVGAATAAQGALAATASQPGHTHIFYGEIVDSLLDGGEQILADIGAAASSHTHAASAISDSTTAGRALLTAADAAAQRTSLGLGTLATQSGTFSGTSSGTNTGDQTISLTGDVTGSGTGSFAATIASNAVTNAKLAQVATSTLKGRATASTGNVEDLTATQVRSLLNVADGATANSSDATLLARANHTGTQAASTITGLAAIATSGSASDLGSGTVPIARIPTGTSSTTVALGDHTHSADVSDSSFRVSDNGDSSKKVALECSGISASTTRTLTVANRSGTVVVSDTSAGSGSDVVNNIVSLTQAEYNAIGSPDAATLYLITDP